MYSEPCARLTRSMMPKTSVRPAASRNSSMPNCTPFKHCSKKYSIPSERMAPYPRTLAAKAASAKDYGLNRGSGKYDADRYFIGHLSWKRS